MSIYEGSEKKCEIIVDSSRLNLRSFPRSFWEKMVGACGAAILSSVHNQVCDAYLLSESSLFVWKERFLLITCGQTKLIESILYFLENIEQENIRQLLFHRKNEYFSDMQHSDFDSDVRRLQQKIEGKTAVFGDLDGHFTKLFYLERDHFPSKEEQSYELLMYDISDQAVAFLLKPNHSKEELRDFFLLSTIIPHFTIDDFTFNPCGYSLNAIHEKQYLTIHVTPQPEHSYVSLETNIPLQQILEYPLRMLEPRTFDIITHQLDEKGALSMETPQSYHRLYQQGKKLNNGYVVQFYHCGKKLQNEQREPQILGSRA